MAGDITQDAQAGTPGASRGLDTSVAHSARVYDYWLGGHNHFDADRRAAKRYITDFPGIIQGVQEQRKFLARAVRYLAAEQGVRQFLDIGTGLPTASNTHEVAQDVAAESRIVYVDNDPMVLLQARALLTGTPQGATAYLDADLRDPDVILAGAAATLDFTQPVAIMLIGVLQLIGDEDDPYGIVRHLLGAVPDGSWLALAQPTMDLQREQMTRATGRLNERVSRRVTLRSHAEISRFFDGTEVVPPGVVQLPLWDPSGAAAQIAEDVPAYCGVGRKR